jgi:hypothetical protein
MTKQEYIDLEAKNVLLHMALDKLNELSSIEQKEITHDHGISQYYKSVINTLAYELDGNKNRMRRFEAIGK